jgi:hypothetical protein
MHRSGNKLYRIRNYFFGAEMECTRLEIFLPATEIKFSGTEINLSGTEINFSEAETTELTGKINFSQ